MRSTLRLLLLSVVLFCTVSEPAAQPTTGLTSFTAGEPFPGYNLIFPHNQPHVYLLNNCGQIVHRWNSPSVRRPGNTAYLLPDGNIVIASRYFASVNDPIWAGGGGEYVEIRNWDNDTLWSFTLNDTLRRLHHDIAPMPNGNILMIAWELKTFEEAVQAGRNPVLMPQHKFWPDYIFEINPATNNIVWEWHVWDHLIQDFDPTKDNFGSVAAHPELVDLNYDDNGGNPDWMHSNAIDYNPVLDQIALSVPTFNEIWIIDHSTTTEEAAGHTGGRSGRGGDLLYRWGNPSVYGAGDSTHQRLFYPHDIHWADDFLDASHPHYGKLVAFNNQVGPNFSSAEIFNPAFDTLTWSYPMAEGRWLPVQSDQTVMHPVPTRMYSDGTSSIRLQPNGNILLCSGRQGYAFELNEELDIVWEYITPLVGGVPIAQGSTATNNLTFRMERYPESYPGLEDKDLSPKGYIELNPDTTFCSLISSIGETDTEMPDWKLYPNPAGDELWIEWNGDAPAFLEFFDAMGRLQHKTKPVGNTPTRLSVTDWPSGVYYLSDGRGNTARFVVRR